MKKKIFISCFVGLIGFLCCGCGVSSLLGKNVCPHENYEIGKVRYEHGPCCEDQMTVYTICKDCGEEVIAGTIPSDSKPHGLWPIRPLCP